MEIISKVEGGAVRAVEIDEQALAGRLRDVIEGEVRFDQGSRALYATAAGNYRQVPIGVVVPKTTEDIIKTVAFCREYGAPVLTRGGGTSLAGQTCNVAVVIDISKYLRKIIELDASRKRARVEPGVVLDDLRNEAEKSHLTFAPDPSTHTHCTLGGMIGNNSCGVHSVMGGKTSDNVETMKILTYDGMEMEVGPATPEQLQNAIAEGGRRGEIYSALLALRDRYADLVRQRYPKIPRRVSGYNLDELLPENGFKWWSLSQAAPPSFAMRWRIFCLTMKTPSAWANKLTCSANCWSTDSTITSRLSLNAKPSSTDIATIKRL